MTQDPLGTFAGPLSQRPKNQDFTNPPPRPIISRFSPPGSIMPFATCSFRDIAAAGEDVARKLSLSPEDELVVAARPGEEDAVVACITGYY